MLSSNGLKLLHTKVAVLLYIPYEINHPHEIHGILKQLIFLLLALQLADTVQDFAQFKRQEPRGPSVRSTGPST